MEKKNGTQTYLEKEQRKDENSTGENGRILLRCEAGRGNGIQ